MCDCLLRLQESNRITLKRCHLKDMKSLQASVKHVSDYVPRRFFILCMRILLYYITFLGNQKHSNHYTGPFKGIVWTGIQKTERFVRNELNQFEWFSSQPTHWTKTCLILTCLVRSQAKNTQVSWQYAHFKLTKDLTDGAIDYQRSILPKLLQIEHTANMLIKSTKQSLF